MTTESTPTSPANPTGTPAHAPAADPPAAGAAQPAPAGKGAPAAAAAPAAPPAKPEPRELSEDDEPDEKDTKVTLSADQFRRRITRGSKQYLKEHFGTDDPKALKEKLARLEALESQAEEQRLAQLSESERLKEQLAAAQRDREAAVSRANALEEARQVSTVNEEVRAIASQYVKGKFYRHVAADFADHIAANYTAEQMERMTDQDVHAWFKQYAAENPEYAAGAAAAPAAPTPKAPVTNGVTQTSKPSPIVSGSLLVNGKTAKPGQPNSMSKAEYEAYKREQKISY